MWWVLVAAVVCYSVGHFHGYLIGRKVKDEEWTGPRWPLITRCECTHSVSSHDQTGKCLARMTPYQQQPFTCSCQRIVAGKWKYVPLPLVTGEQPVPSQPNPLDLR
jgi:hypothetical protein